MAKILIGTGMTTLTEKVFLKIPSPIFSDKEIMSVLKCTDDARYALLKRALAEGEIIRLRRGLYMLSKEYRKREIHPFVLAQYIDGPSYVSLETALAFHGWIPEAVYGVMSVNMGRVRKFITPAGDFDYARVPQNTFYGAVERVKREDGVFFMASPLKALADYVYVNKKDWDGLGPVRKSLRVDDDVLKAIDPSVCDELIENYRSVRVKRFLRGIKKEIKRCR